MSTTSGSKLRIHKFEFDPSDQFRSLTLLCTTLYLSINICFQDVGGMLSLANQGYRGKRWKLIYSGIFYSLINVSCDSEYSFGYLFQIFLLLSSILARFFFMLLMNNNDYRKQIFLKSPALC